MTDQDWNNLNPELYILAWGPCKRCHRSVPVNKYNTCWLCDHFMPITIEEKSEEHDEEV